MSVSQAIGFEIFAKDKATHVFDTITKSIHDTQRTTEQWKVGAIAAGAGVSVGLMEFAKQSVEAYTESQKAQTALSEAYRKFPTLADTSLQKLRELADETQNKTKFDHNAAMQAEANLATFHLTGSQIEQLLPLVADYAAKTGKDLPEASLLVGKALVGNVRALKDVGINYHATALSSSLAAKGSHGFTDALNKVKTSGVPVDFLIKSLRQQVGGYAEHEAADATDQTIMMKHNFDDLKETVGKYLVPALSHLLVVGVAVTHWMGEHSLAVHLVVGAVLAYVAAAKLSAVVLLLQEGRLKTLITENDVYRVSLLVGAGVQKAWAAIMAFSSGVVDGAKEALAGMTLQQALFSRATKIATAVQVAFSAAMDFALGPIGLVIVAVAAVAAGIIYAYKHSQTFRTIVNDTWHVIATGAQWLWNSVLKPVFRFITEAWMSVAGAIIHGAASAFGWVPGIGPKLKDAARKFDQFKADVNNALNGVHDRKVTVSAGLEMLAGGKTTLAYAARHQGMMTGGPVHQPGADPTRDSVLRALQPGEFVIRRDGSNLADALAYYGHGMKSGGLVITAATPSRSAIGAAVGAGYDRGVAGAFANLLRSGSAGAGSGVARWAGLILQVLALLHQSPSLLGAVERRMNLESGGNPNAINLTDSNAAAGDPSRGLMQVIMGTFMRYAGPFLGLGIYNPLANTYAGLNYALHTYGSIAAIDPRVRSGGYDSGGILHPGWTLAYNGTGKPETIRTFEQEQALGGMHVHVYIGDECIDEHIRVVTRRENTEMARSVARGRR